MITDKAKEFLKDDDFKDYVRKKKPNVDVDKAYPAFTKSEADDVNLCAFLWNTMHSFIVNDGNLGV